MKLRNLTNGRVLLLCLVATLTIGLVSWDFRYAPGRYHQTLNDTTPKKTSDKKVRDLDDVLDQLDAVDFKFDAEKIQKEISAALKNLDISKMQLDVQKAMRELNVEDIMKNVEKSLSAVNMEKLTAEMAHLKTIDMAEIQKELKASIEKIDLAELKQELAKVSAFDSKEFKAEMEKVQEEMKKLGPQLAKEMENAKVEIEKVKVEMKEYKEFVDGLSNDGLLNKKEPYTIIHKDGELTVNGKKVSAQIYTKYQSFLSKHKTFTIDKSADDFNIDVD